MLAVRLVALVLVRWERLRLGGWRSRSAPKGEVTARGYDIRSDIYGRRASDY